VLHLNIDLCFCKRNDILAFTLLGQFSFESNHTNNAVRLWGSSEAIVSQYPTLPKAITSLISPKLSLRHLKQQFDTAITFLSVVFWRCSVRISAKAAAILSEAFTKQVLGYYLEVTVDFYPYITILPPYSTLNTVNPDST
jgi:hypothetical protein